MHIAFSFSALKKVGFTSFFPCFAGSDVLIQCMSTTTHSLSNQTFYWSNAKVNATLMHSCNFNAFKVNAKSAKPQAQHLKNQSTVELNMTIYIYNFMLGR